jgi:hypothetical protein
MSAHVKQECNQEEKIEEIKAKVCHIDKTLFFGNGKPGLVSQVDMIGSKLDGIISIGKALVIAVCLMFLTDLYQLIKSNHEPKGGANANSSK